MDESEGTSDSAPAEGAENLPPRYDGSPRSAQPEPMPKISGGGPYQTEEILPPAAPGDEAAPGTPGTGENICPLCSGSGTQNGVVCANCKGTGRITEGIGGA